jgi:integrase
MELVEPIRDRKQIDNIKNYLQVKNPRDHLLFTLGINSGLRISDLLQLTVEQVKDKDRIKIKEQKTGKPKDYPIPDNCKAIIHKYLKTTGLTTGPLFPSRKGGTPITRQHAWTIINDAAHATGFPSDVSLGTHTLRKTFGYHAYQDGKDITRIQKLLNHSSPGVTLAYIGITKDELDDIVLNLNL